MFWTVVVTVGMVIAAGCASTTPTPNPSEPRRDAQVTADPTAAAAGECDPDGSSDPEPTHIEATGRIRVLAAASLTGVFDQIAKAFETRYPKAKVDVSYGASSDLVAQIHQGAPADVLATADPETMDHALDPSDGSPPDVTTPVTLTCNTMTIITAPKNPVGIHRVADLKGHGVRLVLCAPQVPCGRLGRDVLQRAGVDARPVGFEANVKAVVAKVVSGEVDAGIVYVTDARAADGKVHTVEIPASQNVITTYPIARIRSSRNPRTATAFIAFATGPSSRTILKSHGFGGR